MSKLFKFKCIPSICVYDSDNFKIYGCYIDTTQYPDVKINKYGTVTIKGDIPELIIGADYNVKAEIISDKYGISYKVINIRQDKPTTIQSARTFLNEIITEKQTDVLLAAYPDIIERVMNNRLDDIDLNKTKGIKEYTFNVIKTKIIENFKLAELVEEFNGVFSLSVIKKIYNNYTSIEKIREKIKEDPYKCLCNLGGIGFKTADKLLLNLDEKSKELEVKGEKPILQLDYELVSSYQRAKACAVYILGENEGAGHTFMFLKEFKDKICALVPEAYENLAALLNDNDIVFDRIEMLISKSSTYNTEKYIAQRIKEAININTYWDCDYSKFSKIDGFELTEEQKKTSEYMCKYNIVMLVGYGGSGKSSSTKAFVDMLDVYHKGYLLLAPTGRAAKVLSGFTNKDAKTIHRGLGYDPANGWIYNEENKLPYDVVIVDEFSMVDIFLFKHLLEAINFNKTKLLIIGDDAQIPSVGAGNVLYDLLKYNKIPTITLNKIFRYGSGGLSTVATDVRKGKKYLCENKSNIQVFGEDKSYISVMLPQDKLVDYAVNIYKSMINQGYNIEDVTLLSCYNVGDYGTIELNKMLQNAVNPNQEEKITFGDFEFRLNDIVMNCINDYKAIVYNEKFLDKDNTTFVANGESGKVVKILKDAMVIDYDGVLVYCPKNSMKNIRLAYAISVHKCQGSQFKVVIFLTPRAHTFMLNSNLLYVGISRAKEKCFHLGEIKTVNTAIKKKENFDRKTLLTKFLKR